MLIKKGEIIMHKKILYIPLLLTLTTTILKIEAIGYGEQETPNPIKKQYNITKKSKKPEFTPTQKLITILKRDNINDLEAFIHNYKHYKFNKLRYGSLSTEKTTALIDAIELNAQECLSYLIKNKKFTKNGFKIRSSDNFYPLDYALYPKIKYSILDTLVPAYNDPREFISPNYQKHYDQYLQRSKFRTA
jgi:hypothetical protein